MPEKNLNQIIDIITTVKWLVSGVIGLFTVIVGSIGIAFKVIAKLIAQTQARIDDRYASFEEKHDERLESHRDNFIEIFKRLRRVEESQLKTAGELNTIQKLCDEKHRE